MKSNIIFCDVAFDPYPYRVPDFAKVDSSSLFVLFGLLALAVAIAIIAVIILNKKGKKDGDNK